MWSRDLFRRLLNGLYGLAGTAMPILPHELSALRAFLGGELAAQDELAALEMLIAAGATVEEAQAAQHITQHDFRSGEGSPEH